MGTEDFIKILKNIKEMDGKVVGEDRSFIKAEMGKDNKEAWLKHMVEQYLKHEKIDTPPPDIGITKKDFVKEIARREIAKMFDKG